MNIHSSLIKELLDKAYRDAYVASQIRVGLPFQARALRRSKGWTQEQLADAAGMSQPRIAEIEKPGKRRFNLDTLLRIASAFDVGLEVRFVPFGDVIDHNESFDPDTFYVPSFADELAAEEQEETALADFRAAYDRSSFAQQAASIVSGSAHSDLMPSNILQAGHPGGGGVMLTNQPPVQSRLPLIGLARNTSMGASDPLHRRLAVSASPAA